MRSLTRITPLVFRNVRRRSGKRPIQFAILTFILLVSVGNIIGPASARVQTVRFIVSFKPQVGQIERTQTMNIAGGHVTSQLGIINGAVAEIPLRQVEELRRNPDVASVEEDAPVTASDLSSDIQILANLTWAIETNGTGVRLAILDTGISTSNPEFGGRIVACRTEVQGTSSCEDDNGHGTHVAGIAGAAGINTAARGVAPNVQFLEDKVLDSNGGGSISQIIAGIQWAINNGAKVISMSLSTSPADNGGTSSNCDASFSSLSSAVKNAVANGVTVVAAAGNSGGQGMGAPGCLSSVIAVGAVDSTDTLASFSSVGAGMKDHGIVAPGVNIYSTWLSSSYKTLSGTSMATPVVSGTVALLLSRNSTLTPAAVKRTLFTTATCTISPCPNNSVGYGRIDALKAITGTGQQVPLGFDFSVSVNPKTTTLSPSAVSSATVSVNLLSGASQPVSLSTSISPAESLVSASLSTPTGNPSFTSTLSIQTNGNTPQGTYVITIQGMSGGSVRTASYIVNVASTTQTTQDFSLATFPTNAVLIFQGGIASAFVTVTPKGSFSSPVSITLSPLSGFSTSFYPNPVVTYTGSVSFSILTIFTDNTVPPGIYVLTVTGTSGSLSHSTTITIQVIGF